MRNSILQKGDMVKVIEDISILFDTLGEGEVYKIIQFLDGSLGIESSHFGITLVDHNGQLTEYADKFSKYLPNVLPIGTQKLLISPKVLSEIADKSNK